MDKSNSRIEMLKQFLAADPADDFSEYAIALEYEKKGNRKDALFHLERILNRNPDYLATYYQAGRLYEAEKDLTKATAVYQKGIIVAGHQKNQKTLNELRSALELLE